tara:strand:- start:250 stop:1056 length:807 start_codon:yes stop_codon:yes gene_type:complete
MSRAKRIAVRRWEQPDLGKADSDSVAVEEPLEIRIRGRSITVTMRTPGHDAELATGFLLAESVISSRSDIIEIAPCQEGESALHGNVLNVFLAPNVSVELERFSRHVFSGSSCGLCGKAAIENIHTDHSPLKDTITVPAKLLAGLPHHLEPSQDTFTKTGGLHAAGLFNERGELLVCREDIGRHNAVDKVIGHAIRNDLDMSRCILTVSSRASFEIMQKALAARIPVVVAVSAPSSLAVEFANSSGQILTGFTRGNRMNIYAGADRVT